MIDATTLMYFGVSCETLMVQIYTFSRIRTRHNVKPKIKLALLRTASCRVFVALVYVTLGIAALIKLPGTGRAVYIALLSFMILWQVNGILDSQLAKALAKQDGE